MTANPHFSIVTISFNQAEFLPRTIDSVLAQRVDECVQYIVCDPGSTDSSRAIINRYGDAINVRVFQKDRGAADGLNKGFAHATGTIYGYLNSDDTLLPGALAKVRAFFDAHPEIDVVSGHALVIDAHDRVLRTVYSEPFSRRMVAYSASVQIQPSTFIRAEAFWRTGGFNSDNRAIWDGELMVDLFLSGACLTVLNEVLSCYRLHVTSITGTGAQQHQRTESEIARFHKLMGRSPLQVDRYCGYVARVWKHLRAPRATLERMWRGPVFKRKL